MIELGQPLASGRTADIYAWGESQVLKLFMDWCPPHWVEFEAKIATAVTRAGLPTPAAGDIVEVQGRRGLIFERVQGLSMLEVFNRQPWQLVKLARLLADLQVEMHQLTLPDLPPQRRMLEQSIRSAPGLSDQIKTGVLQALEGLPDGEQLCHGDFHPDNVLLTPRGALIIDWMTGSRGNPWADVARTCLLLSVGALPERPLARWFLESARRLVYRIYLNRYQAAMPDPEGQLQAWLPIVAAARLNENIPGESPRLLQMVMAAFAGQAPAGPAASI